MKNKYNLLNTSYLLLIISSFSFNAYSQDRTFAYAYNSTVLSKGLKDIEAWGTYRTGRNYLYNRLDTRLELEIGLTDRLQTAFYFNGSHVSSGFSLDTLGGIADTSVSGIINESEFSVSSEWKWKISDPVANGLGFSLYGELTVSPSSVELEHKFIFDKKINKNIFALNLIDEYVWVHDQVKGKKETVLDEIEFETDLAWLYLCKPNTGFGIEMRQHNVFEEGKDWKHSGLFAGPTLFHSGEKYFIILNLMPQLANLKKSDLVPGALDLNEYEKFSVRLLLGFGL